MATCVVTVDHIPLKTCIGPAPHHFEGGCVTTATFFLCTCGLTVRLRYVNLAHVCQLSRSNAHQHPRLTHHPFGDPGCQDSTRYAACLASARERKANKNQAPLSSSGTEETQSITL
jgi:hypothetical protein